MNEIRIHVESIFICWSRASLFVFVGRFAASCLRTIVRFRTFLLPSRLLPATCYFHRVLSTGSYLVVLAFGSIPMVYMVLDCTRSVATGYWLPQFPYLTVSTSPKLPTSQSLRLSKSNSQFSNSRHLVIRPLLVLTSRVQRLSVLSALSVVSFFPNALKYSAQICIGREINCKSSNITSHRNTAIMRLLTGHQSPCSYSYSYWKRTTCAVLVRRTWRDVTR
jgi:hypothetical protein